MAEKDRQLVVLVGGGALTAGLQAAGYRTAVYPSVARLAEEIKKTQARACVIEADAVTSANLAEVIKRLRRAMPFTDVLLWAPKGSARLVREALTSGAKDVVLSSRTAAVVERVSTIVEEQKILPRLRRYKQDARDTWRFEGIISRSPRMWDIFDTCARVAKTDATVLVLGETGTGKELVARAIHRRSYRKGRFVALNFGAVPESLIDSELFGHVKGSFTGATEDKDGLFRHAEGGTLLLDEIGDIPLPVQFRLLRALQEETIRPVGGDQEIAVDVRVVAATSRYLDDAVRSGSFREDLLYRLDVIRIEIPPLAERPEDIILLFEHFSDKLSRHYRIKRPAVTDTFLEALQSHEWPGNVRQLQNFTERLLLTRPQERLTQTHFLELLRPLEEIERTPGTPRRLSRSKGTPDHADTTRPLQTAVDEAIERTERAYLEAVLSQDRGRVGRAAERAGISRRTLLRKMKLYGIDKRAFRVTARRSR